MNAFDKIALATGRFVIAAVVAILATLIGSYLGTEYGSEQVATTTTKVETTSAPSTVITLDTVSIASIDQVIDLGEVVIKADKKITATKAMTKTEPRLATEEEINAIFASSFTEEGTTTTETVVGTDTTKSKIDRLSREVFEIAVAESQAYSDSVSHAMQADMEIAQAIQSKTADMESVNVGEGELLSNINDGMLFVRRAPMNNK